MNFFSFLKKDSVVMNHEGAVSYRQSAEMELYTAVVTCAMEDLFYEGSFERVRRIAELVPQVNPVFVAKLAVYARREMHLRSIPLVLLVELAKIHNGDDLVARAVKGSILRADEIAELLMCYQWLNPSFGPKKLSGLSRGIQNGLKEAFNRFDEYQFAKYDRDGAVKLRDALFLVHPKAKDEAQQKIFDKIASGSLETPYTWETELSAVGQKEFKDSHEKDAAFRAKWEELIDSGKLGYMALLRNLRNILMAGVDLEHIKKVCGVLANPSLVLNSRQFPFRFLSAFKEVMSLPSVHTERVLKALEAAVKVSAANIEGFDENTSVLIASDVSGSMYTPVSKKSSVMIYEIGLMMSMLLKSRCGCAITGIFGDVWKVKNLPADEILTKTITLTKMANEVGFSTNGHLVIDYLIHHGLMVDKVLMFTDCQMWDSNDDSAHIRDSWLRYRKMNPKASLYLFDLAGYGQSPLSLKGDGVYLIAGWSEKVFSILDAVEHGSDALKEIKKIQL